MNIYTSLLPLAIGIYLLMFLLTEVVLQEGTEFNCVTIAILSILWPILPVLIFTAFLLKFLESLFGVNNEN